MRAWPVLLFGCALTAAGCGAHGDRAGAARPLAVGAIPDQDPEVLQRLYGSLAAYLHQRLGVPVVYRPVTDYAAAVTAFRVGDLDLVWFGGLTGVQAQQQVPGAHAIAQRDEDRQFHSLFIASARSGLRPFTDSSGLAELRGHSFTFGSESSTSGRLMPQFFLSQAGLTLDDFRGRPGFSGSHDATIQLVEAGSYDAGVVNEQVWRSRLAAGRVDTTRVRVLWRTPPYHDYHWLIRPDVEPRFGPNFAHRVQQAFVDLDPSVPADRTILRLFGAQRFVAATDSDYAQIEAVARDLHKID